MTKIRVTLWITLLVMILTMPIGLSFAHSDTDGDGITDDVDQCIYDYGHTTAFGIGCPDRDGDGWHDWDDACPDTWGGSWLEPTRGCP
ncbi:MAG TPA: hypothetical protein PLZ51_20135, partial [Aggregatilineales bacterium]|nr:hypothetical protein [Aggregatilineales bacterium]